MYIFHQRTICLMWYMNLSYSSIRLRIKDGIPSEDLVHVARAYNCHMKISESDIVLTYKQLWFEQITANAKAEWHDHAYPSGSCPWVPRAQTQQYRWFLSQKAQRRLKSLNDIDSTGNRKQKQLAYRFGVEGESVNLFMWSFQFFLSIFHALISMMTPDKHHGLI